MFVAAHEWTAPPPQGVCPAAPQALARAPHDGLARALYDRLAHDAADAPSREDAADYLRQTLEQTNSADCDLPESAHDLDAWMHNSAQRASANYRAYLEERKAGGPRRYFKNRAHALYFLRNVAPTKLVDGAWLYGLLAHWENRRLSGLISIYLEELGEGAPDKNHVLLYRRLLQRHGLELAPDLPDALYTQGALQLALGWNAAEFLPEVVGFNLGYEQLPLHLLITAYELNELGIDPYYFTLHITVDNSSTGHAQQAVQAVRDTLPRLGGGNAGADFWRRLRQGYALSNAGVGTTQVIAGFDIEQEVQRILARKSAAGHGAHSDYCRVAGLSVNEWLAQPHQVPGFVAALRQAGWIRHGEPVQASRFWQLLQGERAAMFGVFSGYELQLIHDWIRGDASVDGQAHDEPARPAGQRRPSFRAQAALAAAGRAQPGAADLAHGALADADPDLAQLQTRLAGMSGLRQQAGVLVEALSPSTHWTPAGLYATRQFRRLTA